MCKDLANVLCQDELGLQLIVKLQIPENFLCVSSGRDGLRFTDSDGFHSGLYQVRES